MIGATLGPYQILAKLGEGGMRAVYKARDSRLDRFVALKLLPADLASDPERLSRFEREAQAASALNHPAIVTIYDVGTTDRQPWISMELVEGKTLREVLDAGSVPLRRALSFAAQIADGLAKAHEAGIIHRDLKPENVMVSADGFAKILDFGLARLTLRRAERETSIETRMRDTEPGRVMGTLAYMSPEQASGAVGDFRSDQFSFGAVLYEMLAGTRAFERSSSTDTLAAILRDNPRPVAELNAAVPPLVRWIVERSLEKPPADRYGSTRDLARDLAQARDHLSELSTTASSPNAPARKRSGARAWTLVGWVVAAISLMTTAALLVRSPTAMAPGLAATVRFALPAPEGTAILASGLESSPVAVSPDGRYIVAVATNADGKRSLWLRPLDGLMWRQLRGTDDAFAPFWSPDSRAVGFSRPDRLQQIAIVGEEVRTIYEGFALGGAWNRDGVILFTETAGISRISANGGTPEVVVEGDGLWPVFLPDGKQFLFVSVRSEMGIHLMSLDSREHTRILPLATNDVGVLGFTPPNYLLFVQGRTLVAQALDLAKKTTTGEPVRVAEGVELRPPSSSFSVSPTGALVYSSGSYTTSDLVWAGRDGTIKATAVPRVATALFAISPDGARVAVGRDDTTPNSVWLHELSRGAFTPVATENFACCPVWSRDGKQIAFASARGSPPNLYVASPGSANGDERLTQSPSENYPFDFSLDGQFLIYGADAEKTAQGIWLLPMKGQRQGRPLLDTAFNEWFARVSPNGRWVAYVSNESGQDDVWVARFPEADERQVISVGGGTMPVWRSDGRDLYYQSKDAIVAVTIEPGDRLEAGPPERLFDARALRADYRTRSFDVAPNGQFLLNRVVERRSLPLTVVTDWRAGLVK